ncbi:MAG: MbcA/ParS/Xre antitoxin family protein [Burkholderiales bacterium]
MATEASEELIASNSEKVSAPALRTFFRIADSWDLSNKERIKLLGSPARSTFYYWKHAQGVALPRDTLERLSYVFGIYKALQILLPRPEAADAWIKKPNAAPLFGGHSALDRMLSGQVGDLFLVRQYLDAQRGGWA